ncbi:MAG: VWA domain-containing protein [Candidatus Moraniibacteriota bacterium]|nr:MAG: VWA domain-containing protein [Candidatus Moranbacteria bacterium]
MDQKNPIGGVIHVYQKYDPLQFPSPTALPPDLISPAMEHALMYGQGRALTEEELARAIRLDPSQIAGLGPSIESLRAILEERKRKILSRFETDSVEKKARKAFHKTSRNANPPDRLRVPYRQAIEERQIYDLERIYYRVGNDQDPFARQLVHVIERLADQVQIESLISKYTFTGNESMTVPQAIEIKKELEEINELLRQLTEAEKNARIAIIDMEALSKYVPEGDLNQMEELRKQVEQLMRDIADQQGLSSDGKGGFELTPQAMRIFQGRLLEKIFSHLQPSRSGRHTGRIVGDGAVELPSTKGYEFGDSLANMDVTQSVINAMLKRPNERPTRLRSDDIEVHRTRNSPKCATVVIMDMSGSMRHDGQYINVKRMALALQGLITREYPGDFLRFIEMYTFAKLRPAGEIINLMPKRVTIHDPWVRLRADMSRDEISENQIHPHFTNIQHALQLARQNLATVDTPNRQIVLITDGLPTAHFEGSQLYMLYPPDPRTESATLREGLLCQRDGIVINMFLLPSWSQTEDDIRFSYRLAESTRGRVFFTAGRDLDRFVVWDYVQRKRDIIS